jgi:succinate dehydrogenase / fumarate reductase cytochrome b subunit
MRRVINLYRTSVGKKFYMAVSGAILIGFLVAHMVGNLKMYMGAEAFNHYAEFLREVGYPVLPHMVGLWIFRVILLFCVGLHMLSAWQVYLQSRSARGGKYAKEESLYFSYASRTMRWGGVIIAAFVIYHILHFTVGSLHPDFVAGDAYRNVILGFQSWWVTGFYTVTLVMVTFHLYHGLWSAFQTVGANHPKYNPYRRPLALALALILFLGFMSVPVGVKTRSLALENSGSPAHGVAAVEAPDTDGGE